MMDALLQWIGFAFVLGGYWRFGANKYQGAVISMIGGVALLLWCALQPVTPWGVTALQFGCILINAHNMHHARAKR